ncbi:AAA domain (dynein-related subfamily) [Pseudobythopirellula maris]|uniref:AAA domain (Dynein-related subfamily) n=1 Tax=Pseudobythopirellula maris TaxID=2527991 RepID=A0A5C5ZIV9_9BACT|nr:AAA family ATPase [Pseudobythopirellula maris]TWT87186.1 AAA domain (dynein-related subfamily) [Pseudobythopirellula maris]
MAKQQPPTETPSDGLLREPPELRYKTELEHLVETDDAPRPEGWRLSPRAVRTFVLGSEAAAPGKRGRSKRGAKAAESAVRRKFHGDDAMVDRAIVTLMSNRALILVGEPGTAKSMLSELLAAAVSGTSGLTIQGTAGTTEDQIKYSWNYALLLAEGPTPRALVPAPLYRGLAEGRLVRFEEITRCPPEIQDTLVSVLSDKLLHVPELAGGDGVVYARPGFNIVATANTRDRGVHEMSAALKRRFNFETVHPIADKGFELELVLEEARELLGGAGVEPTFEPDVIDVLVTTFHDLRNGRTEQGVVVERPSAVMSTAEAVSVAFAAGLDAWHFGDRRVEGQHLARQLVGAVLKDSDEDAKKVRQYFDVVVKQRSKKNPHWKSFFDARGVLGK